ncbi:hypothetical protein VPNG_04860 [Cytospora leucostoma]|uniref:Uncharacterized protein n=1 Tax=Cytospora leucostoma TaxID=1230097 RepID=A0A423XB87_9PEZI|nr:hypothetical protein VPNG_04860 [Cytospora leucostoma]
MVPDQTDEEPHLLEEDYQEHSTEATPHQEISSLAVGSVRQSSARENDHRHAAEPQFEVIAKHTKSYSVGNTPTPKSFIITSDDYDELCRTSDDLRQELAAETRAVEAEQQMHKITKANLADAKKELVVKSQDYKAIQFHLAKVKDEFKILSKQHEHLKKKAEGIEDQLRSLEATQSQSQDLQRERNSLKLQVQSGHKALAETQEKLTSTQNELRATEKQLEEATQEGAALRIVNDKNGAHNSRIKARVEKSKKELAKAQEDHKTREAAWGREKSDLEAKYKALRKESKKKEIEWTEQRAKLVKNLRENRGQEHRYINKVPDDKLKEMYGNLRFQVSQFVQKYAGQLPSALAGNQQLEPIWEELTPNATKFLMSGVLHVTITEAYIWEWLRRMIFVPGSKYWGGDIGALFGQVLGLAQHEIKGPSDDPTRNVDYHHWRASSSNFLASIHEPRYNPESCRPDAEAIVMNLSRIWEGFDVGDATKDAMEILDDARKLDVTLRTLKAEFTLVFTHANPDIRLIQRFGFPFSGAGMSDAFRNLNNRATRQAVVVDLVISPALFKQGNNDGADYHTSSYCIKMEVVCNASQFFLQTMSDISMQTGAAGPQVNADILHVVQAVKKEEVSEGVDHEPNQAPHTSSFFKPGSAIECGNVVLQPGTQVEVNPNTSTKAIAPGPKPGKSIDACGYEEESSLPQAGGSGGRRTRKRKWESNASDDELDEDYRPGSSAKPAAKRLTTRRQLRHLSAYDTLNNGLNENDKGKKGRGESTAGGDDIIGTS